MPLFRTYLESNIFGSPGGKLAPKPTPPDPDLPIKPFSVEWMMEALSRQRIPGSGKATHAHLDKIIWGDGVGAVRIRLTSNIIVFIEKLVFDLSGGSVWILKRVFRPKLREYAGKEDFVAGEIFSFVQQFYSEAIEAPRADYDILGLVNRAGKRLKHESPDTFIFQDIRELEPDHYLIRADLRAGGLGRTVSVVTDLSNTPSAVVEIFFDKKRGVLRIILSTVSTGQRGADWAYDIPELDATFCPSQNKDEIIDILVATLRRF